ncbi:MAG: hypothetical protein SGPRY_010528 [Prymnesium sp.]
MIVPSYSSAKRPSAMGSSVLAGALHEENKGALDYGCGLLAVGVERLVLVLSPQPPSLLTSLQRHTARVSVVRWAGRPPSVWRAEGWVETVLASADTTGRIILWDVSRSLPLACLAEMEGAPQPRPILSLHWLPSRAGAGDGRGGKGRDGEHAGAHARLLCVQEGGEISAYHLDHHPPETAQPTRVLWSQRLSMGGGGRGGGGGEAMTAVAVDPSDPGRLALLFAKGSLCELSGLGRVPADVNAEARSSAFVVEAVGGGAGARGKPIQMHYSLHERRQLYFLLPREILLCDLTIGQVRIPAQLLLLMLP